MPGLRVRATAGQEDGATIGFIYNVRRREGDEFELVDPKHFSFRWMEALDFDPENDYGLKRPEDARLASFEPQEVPGAVVQPTRKRKPKKPKKPYVQPETPEAPTQEA